MKIDTHDQEMFLSSLKKLKQTLDTQEQEQLPPIEDDRLFKACLYIGKKMGVKMIHPESDAVVEPEEISAWMEVLSERSGICYRMIELKDDWWKSIVEPFVVFTDKDWTPNVILPKDDCHCILLDIETGTRVVVDRQLAKNIQRVGFIFYESLKENERGVTQLLKLGFKAIKEHTKQIMFVVLLFSCAKLFTPISNQLIFDHVIPTGNVSLFWQLGFALLLMNFSTLALNIVRSFTTLRYRTIIENKMQAALWERFFSLPTSIFHKYQRGDLSQRLNLISNIRPFLMGDAFYTIIEAPFAIVYILMMLYYSVPLGVLMTILMIGFYIASFSIRLYILPLLRKRLQISADINSFLIQAISGITKVRMAAATKRVFSKWANLFADYQKLDFKIGVKQIQFSLLSTLYPIISLAITYTAAVYYLKGGSESMTMGQFVAFQSAFGLLSASVGGVLTLMGDLMQTMQTIKRTDGLLKEPPEQIGPKEYVTSLRGDIMVEHLVFKYPKTKFPVLNDISFHCRPGKFIGLVGRSGCGKSTLLRLLSGLEPLETGRIFFDGMSMRNIDLNSLRRRMGVVLQTATVSGGTVRDNILMGRYASKERLERAIQAAQFDVALKSMPMGLDTLLTTGGGTISGGEKQRLLLARALLTDVDILLLDEATSALDSATQEIVMKNLEELKISRIVVAHRLETVKKADEILVVKNGTVVEKGTFDKLCESSVAFNAMRLPSKKEREKERRKQRW